MTISEQVKAFHNNLADLKGECDLKGEVELYDDDGTLIYTFIDKSVLILTQDGHACTYVQAE